MRISLQRLYLLIFVLLWLFFDGQSFAVTVAAEPASVTVVTIGQPTSSQSETVSSSVTGTIQTDSESFVNVKEELGPAADEEGASGEDKDALEQNNIAPFQSLLPSKALEGVAPDSLAANMRVVLSQEERLKDIIKEYESLVGRSSDFPQWKCTNRVLRIKDQDPILMIVKKQLHYLGFFASSIKGNGLQFTNEFSEVLEKALKQFQKRHFLEPDGVIGRKTCIALNMTPQERVKKIKLNLERWRELEAALKGKYVLVNIPTYKLYAMEDRKVDLSQPVIVGMKSRRTPIFTSNMNSIVLNPAWGVPVTIFIKDKLHKVLKDPDYLSRSGFMVTDQEGQLVTDSSIDWEHVSQNHFPYRIRQLPGKNNALGAIKFNLDNKEAIYLHGTPQKKLFNKIARPFSSGCVRLESPQKLAAWALQGTQYDSLEKLQQKIKTGGTSAILLKEPIPVYFAYITVWVDSDQKLLFSDDPYDLDGKDYARFNL